MTISHPRDMISWIKGAAQRALGGQTPRPLRQYSFSLDEGAKRIVFKAEVDRPLTEDEFEDLDVAETELWSERFYDDEEHIETVIVVVPASVPLSPLQGGVVYCRDPDEPAPG